jgi:N-acetylglucosamine-6-sulfatase
MDSLSRREFLSASACAVAGLTSGASWISNASSMEGTTKRNIILILVDDQRFDAMSCAGHPFLETPHLDRLAQGGALFRNAFVTTSLCSPSRASILTGQYAHRHGVLDNVTPFPPGVVTFPEILQQNGYRTAFIGKWHMGGESDTPRPGFDHWVSFKGQGVYNNPVLNVNGNQEKKEGGYITDILTDYTEEFLLRPHTQPFFLYLSHKAVHAEFTPAVRHKGRYANSVYPHPASMADSDENYRGKPAWVRAQRQSWHGVDGMYNKTTDFDTFARDYAETMLAVDDSIGRLVEVLKDQGLLESTLILYTSDNGFQFGEHGLIDKRTMYETSIRVPLIANSPGLIPPGQNRQELITNLDIAPTILSLAGVPVTGSCQGLSFLDLAAGKPSPWREDFLYEYFWERSFPQTPSVLGIRTSRYKYMKYHGIWDRYELYDLDQDPNEMNNLLGGFIQTSEGGTLDYLIRSKVDNTLRKLVQEMEERLAARLMETGCRKEPSWG